MNIETEKPNPFDLKGTWMTHMGRFEISSPDDLVRAGIKVSEKAIARTWGPDTTTGGKHPTAVNTSPKNK